MLVGCHAEAVKLPAGVLNIVTGLGGDAGAPLSSHPGVNKISFTGSVETGRRVNLAAAANLRPTSMVQRSTVRYWDSLPSIRGVCVAMRIFYKDGMRHCQTKHHDRSALAVQELGGKSALIIFEDADIDKAVEWAMVRRSVRLPLSFCCDWVGTGSKIHQGRSHCQCCVQFSIFWTTGQICTATSRLLVAAPIATQFFDRLKVSRYVLCLLCCDSMPTASFPHRLTIHTVW